MLLSAADRDAIRDALREIGAAHARGEWRVTLELEDGQTALETRLTREARRGRRRVCTRAGHATTRCSRRCASICATPSRTWREAPRASPQALDGLVGAPGRDRAARLYAHAAGDAEQRRALGGRVRGGDPRRRGGARASTMRRIDKNPLGSAAGYGTPNLAVDREITRAALGFAEIHEPVTAVQLSRGKAEAGVLFEIALLMQDLGPARLRRAPLLYAGVRLRRAARRIHDRLVDHAAEAQPRRVRAGPRPHGDRAGLSCRGAGDHRQAAVGLPARPAAHQGAALPRDRPVPRIARHHGRRDRRSALRAGADPARRGHRRRRPRRTHSSWPRGFRSARPTGASRRAVAEPTHCRYRVLQARASGRVILPAWVGDMHCGTLRHLPRPCRSRSARTPFR